MHIELMSIPGHKRLVFVCGWKAPLVCSSQCAGLTYSQPTTSWCWNKTPESHLSTVERNTKCFNPLSVMRPMGEKTKSISPNFKLNKQNLCNVRKKKKFT